MKNSVRVFAVVAICLIATASLALFSACKCNHEWSDWAVSKEAACETEGEKTRSCNKCGEVEKEVLPALGHEEADDAAIDPTCTEEGKTEGTHCARCGKVLVERQSVPALGHEGVVDAAIDPTCTEDGKTEGKHCERCGKVLVEQQSVPALGHDEVIDEAVDPTCTEEGKTEGKHCERCGEVLVPQNDVQALGHDYDDGQCTRCKTWLITEGLGFKYDAFEGAYTVTSFNSDAAADVIIPGEYEGKPVIEVKENVFSGKKIKSVIVAGSVKSIGASAFSGCSSLVKVKIKDGVQTIGSNAFNSCPRLSSLIIPDSVTEIGEAAFDKCGSAIVKENGVQYADGWAVYVEQGLTDVVIKDGSRGIANSVFSVCKSTLRSVKIGRGVKELRSGIFDGCTALTSLSVPDSLLAIDSGVLSDCKNLTYNEYDNAYYLGNENNAYVVLVKAKDETITSCKIHPDTKILYSCAFQNCAIESVEIPSGLVGLGDNVFLGCNQLKMNKYDNAYYLGSADNDYYILMRAASSEITECKVNESTNIIYFQAFMDCTRLTEIALPDSVRFISQRAFYSCENMAKVTLGRGVKYIDRFAFVFCDELNEVDYRGSEKDWLGIIIRNPDGGFQDLKRNYV